MIKMRFHLLRFAFITTTTLILASRGQAGDNCASGFTLCAPPGATSETTPQIGTPAFQTLFVDIVFSSLPASKKVSLSASSSTSLCCRTTLSCVMMINLEIPFCYDQFTTNYFLPDGSYGTVVGGAYNSSTGDLANLISGQYALVNGSTGNIYSNTSAPNIATLPMPSQYTASGVGSAIPASALGNEVTLTYTTTLPGSTSPPSTIYPSTIPPIVTSETIGIETTVTTEISDSIVVTQSVIDVLSTATLAGATFSGYTISGTTISPLVTTITTTEVAPKSTAASTTSLKKSGASRQNIPLSGACFVSLVLMALLHGVQ